MKFILFIPLLLLFTSCDKILLEEEAPNDPVSNFEVLWNEFDAKYGLFKTKHINWDSVYAVYRPQVSSQTSYAELYAVLTEMLGLLNDNHVGLLPTSDSKLPFFQSGILGKMDTINDFDLGILKSSYLTNPKFEDPFFTYGILADNIGYLHIEGFSDLPKYLRKPMDNVLSHVKDTKALIIDVRGGYGGEDIAGQYIAGRFTDKTIPYMKSRVKSGPGKNDFTDFQNWEITPEGDFQYTKPVVLLTHRFTISARETFCLAMKVLHQVTHVGDTTSGAFSNQINRELPNGWGYSISIGQWLDAAGTSHEGVGLAPDVVIQNKKQDVLNGKDEALEEAMSILNQ
jgi:carboxyl-terminal processing protease